ncbi:MAG: anthranilate synthase component II [Acetobacteraceae bacterium]
MLLLIDNYDSFTFNLVHFLGEVGATSEVWRNDAIGVEEALAKQPEAIVLSPGPCTPSQAGICVPLVRAAVGRVPVLGVCLGHQAVGEAFGGTIARAPLPMHGKTSRIFHDGSALFSGVRNPLVATRYHSLIVSRDRLPAELIVSAWTEDGIVMGLRHRTAPVFGVQFHPESIASEDGHAILANFLAIVRGANAPARAA